MRWRFGCVEANAGFALFDDGAMLRILIEIGNITAGKPADLVLEGALAKPA